MLWCARHECHAAGEGSGDITLAWRAAEEQGLTSGPAHCNSVGSDLFEYFSNRFELIQSKVALKISHKIWKCIELNKEQLYLLELFKILTGI
jgi:hypothetical protein